MSKERRTTHTWKGWYPVPAGPLDDVLRAARAAAVKDHPDTPAEAIITPSYRTTPYGVRVFVIGKPAADECSSSGVWREYVTE
jgi:hypothetical protein